MRKKHKGVKEAKLDAYFGQEMTSLCRLNLEVSPELSCCSEEYRFGKEFGEELFLFFIVPLSELWKIPSLNNKKISSETIKC